MKAQASKRTGILFRGIQIWAVAALVAGAALRWWFITHAARIAGDSLLYGDLAGNLLQHGVYGFTTASGIPRPTLIRVPGYPLFLAACFAVFGVGQYPAAMYLQLVADLATCGLVSALAGRLFGRRGAMAALWLAALCPFTANYVAAPLTETLSLFCIAVVFYGMLRWQSSGAGFNRWLWAITAGLGYAVLLRPEQGLLAAAVVPAMLWMGWRGDGRRGVAAVLVASICVVLPLAPCATGEPSTLSSRWRRALPPIPGSSCRSGFSGGIGPGESTSPRPNWCTGTMTPIRSRSRICRHAPSTTRTSTPRRRPS